MVVAVTSTAAVAGSYVGALVAFGVLPADDFGRAALRFWVGDVIGITVLTPFLLILVTRRRLLRPTWELLGLLAWSFRPMGRVRIDRRVPLPLFYLFFLPIIWTAVRFGLEGVTAGLVVTQVALITAIHFSEHDPTDVTAYQALMVVLSFTGLAVGVLVSEQQRTQQQLRINQEALNRAIRLSTMGEFAAALAHEINQPLTAVANYARVAKTTADPALASEATSNVISQVERAAEVIRRLRNFIRLGRSETGAASVTQLIEEAILHCHAELESHGVQLQTRIARDLPAVTVDALQVEQVIINLVRNSAEALSDAGRYDGKVIDRGRPRGHGPRYHSRSRQRARL